MSLTPGEFDVKAGDYIKGEAFNAYLETYAERFHVKERIRLRTKVVSIQHAAREGWLVNWSTILESGLKHGEIHAAKLVIAIGHTNEALLPCFPGQETF